jgi:RecA/RadA recombinase
MAVVEQINKKYGEGTLCTLSQAVGVILHKVSTGSIAVDMLTRGGLVLNKISVVYGKRSAGKTAFMVNCAASFLRGDYYPPFDEQRPRLVIIIDVENSVEPMWLKILGLDGDTTILCSPDSGEQTWDVAADLMDRKDVSLFIAIDSLGGIVSATDMELTEDKNVQPGGQARIINRGLRRLWPRIRTHLLKNELKHTICMLNHVTYKMGVTFGSPLDMPGGQRVQHVGMQIFYIARMQNDKDKESKENKSYTMIVKMDKDKTGGSEGGECEATFYRLPDLSKGILPGFDNYSDIVPFLVKYGVATLSGKTYRLEYEVPSKITKGKFARKLLTANSKKDFADELRKMPSAKFIALRRKLIDGVIEEREMWAKARNKENKAFFSAKEDPYSSEDDDD